MLDTTPVECGAFYSGQRLRQRQCVGQLVGVLERAVLEDLSSPVTEIEENDIVTLEYGEEDTEA